MTVKGKKIKVARPPARIKNGGAQTNGVVSYATLKGGGRRSSTADETREATGKQTQPVVCNMISNLLFALAILKAILFQNKTSEGVNWMRRVTGGLLLTTCGSHISLPVPPQKCLKALLEARWHTFTELNELVCVCLHAGVNQTA